MKFLIKSFLFLLATAAISFTACKKDDEKSAEDNLTAASCWSQVKDELYDTSTNTWIDSPVDDCTKDDCIKFNADKTVSVDEGATKCDPSDPQTSQGVWSLSADGKTMTVDGVAGTVVELSGSKLVLETNFFGIKSRATFQSR